MFGGKGRRRGVKGEEKRMGKPEGPAGRASGRADRRETEKSGPTTDWQWVACPA